MKTTQQTDTLPPISNRDSDSPAGFGGLCSGLLRVLNTHIIGMRFWVLTDKYNRVKRSCQALMTDPPPPSPVLNTTLRGGSNVGWPLCTRAAVQSMNSE